MTKYKVSVIYDASYYYEVEADSPEDAAHLAYEKADARLCHQCSDNLELGDAIRAIVFDADWENELYDDGAKP